MTCRLSIASLAWLVGATPVLATMSGESAVLQNAFDLHKTAIGGEAVAPRVRLQRYILAAAVEDTAASLEDGHEPTLAQLRGSDDAPIADDGDSFNAWGAGWFIFRWFRRIYGWMGYSTWALICALFVATMTAVGRVLVVVFNLLDRATTPQANAALDRFADLQTRGRR